MRTQTFALLALILAAAAVGGCSPTPPYVYKQAEFDRRSPNFNREVTDVKGVVVCYGSWKTTPEQVTAVAEKECAKSGRVAVFSSQNYQRCPLTTPVAALYGCASPSEASGSVARDRSPGPAELPLTSGQEIPPFGLFGEPEDTDE